jgi:hypothetical protein
MHQNRDDCDKSRRALCLLIVILMSIPALLMLAGVLAFIKAVV